MVLTDNKFRGVKAKIPQEAIVILNAYAQHGYDTFFVGGFVRDALNGHMPHDIDICTNATPEIAYEIVKFLNDESEHSQYSVIPTGLDYGTVTINVYNGFGKHSYEVTTFRYDGNYSDGRRPDEVIYSTKIEDDLARRDFTINAIAFNCETGFIDPFKGREDIKNKVIRCVGNPCDRFNEDGLRILRALRFAAQLGFEIEKETSRAIHECVHMLDNVSKERIQWELRKILMSEQCGYKVLKEYEDVLRYIIPEAKDSDLSLFFDSAQYISHEDLITRLALLFIVIEENESGETDKAEVTYSALKNLKFDNETVAYVTQLVSYRDVPIVNTKQNVKRMLNKIGMLQLKRMTSLIKIGFYKNDIAMCSINDYNKKINEIIENDECYSLKQLAINGDDLIEVGVPEGRQIKHVLNLCLQLVINESVDNVKEDLLNVIDAIIESGVSFV